MWIFLKLAETLLGFSPVSGHTHVKKSKPVGQWRTQEFCSGGGSTNSVEDRENRDLGGGSPLVRGSGSSCNLVQKISFHIVKFS